MARSYDDIVKEVCSTGGIVSPILPKANWIGLDGNFTPTQLRIIADEIEGQYKK